MSIINAKLFFKYKKNYAVGSLSFDLLLNENHNRSNTVTDRTVEDGSVISDHIQSDLKTGSLTGLVTNFDINTFGLPTNRAQDAFDELERIQEEEQLVTIVTVLKTYENVTITKASVSRNSSSGEAIGINISFKQVNTVKLQKVSAEISVEANDMGTDTDRQASADVNVGRTTG